MTHLHGCAFYEQGVPYLFVNNRLPRTEQIIAGFHEFAHLVYHSIDDCEFSSDSLLWQLSKIEHQSQTIGVLAAMPFDEVVGLSIEDIMREFGVSRQTAEFRVSLYF
jgi:Zn-dependent peptidase ImmA (M78 family)